jgi:hypothetical protein
MNINDITVKITVRRMWLLKAAAYAQYFVGLFFEWAIKKTVKVG